MAKQERESFHNYTKRIEKVKLQPLHVSSNRLSPQVFLRLGQLQDPDGSLLPSLRHLYISENPYLDHLDLFLSPSLRTLEIGALSTNINHCACLISFLDNAVELSPNLETLILVDSCELPRKVFDSCSKFGRLHRLELREVAASAIDPFLHNMGSLEQHLKKFVLQERRNPLPQPYSPQSTTPSRQTSAVHGLSDGMEVPASDAIPAPSWNITSDSSFPSAARYNTTWIPFATSQGLRIVKIIGTSDLIGKVVSIITSPVLRDLSITFTTNTPRMVEVIVTNKKKEKMEGMRKKAAKLAELITVDSVTYILDIAINRWKALVSISVIADTEETAFLPEDIFKQLFLHPTVRRLEISGFDISSMDSALSDLNSEHHISQLEDLRLSTNHSHNIPFYRLRQIAAVCPRLTYLRCAVDSTSLVPQLSDPMSHQLRDLTVVGDNTGGPDMQQALLVAAYLDCIFPKLKKMEVDGDGGRSEYGREWLQVFDIVKLFQTTRLHERRRLASIL